MAEHVDTPLEAAAKAAIAKATRISNRVIIALVIICTVLAAVVGYLFYRSLTHPLSNQLQSQIAVQQTATKNLELYVQQYAQHGCQALELLTATPVPKPADPAANPSRETTYEFYEALLYWEHADGCKLIAVPVAHG